MLVRKTAETPSPNSKVVPIRGYAKQLDALYARRTAVETLIQSLENYQRFRAQRQEIKTSKTA
jgi:hypothetical protein